MITETQLWQRLGLVEAQQDIHRLYTPAMLADLLGVPVAVIRRWHRRGLIVPAREVRRLPYFDFQEVATARRLADLLAAGVSPQAIEKKLAAFARCLPGVGRPLAQLSVIVHGKEILLAARRRAGRAGRAIALRFRRLGGPNRTRRAGRAAAVAPEQMCRLAAELEEDGQLAAAAEMYRAAMAATGPKAEICFQVAELLYRLGDLGRSARTLLHGRRAGRGLRRGPREPGLRVGRDRTARTGRGRLRRRAALSSRPTPTSIITWPARWTK